MGEYVVGLETPVYDLHVLIKELIEGLDTAVGQLGTISTQLDTLNTYMANDMTSQFSTLQTAVEAVTNVGLVDVIASLATVIGNTASLADGSLPLPVDQV